MPAVDDMQKRIVARFTALTQGALPCHSRGASVHSRLA
ncbi:hypothetical protein PATSB16_42070 [Pandoraea thiooxydans]|nr:hypothetical protein PATSB16_42070 [Pandoraea thiooxydans]